jgi:hypothetical protein
MFDCPSVDITPGAVLINLLHIRGTDAICACVPSNPGIYAFFKTFFPPDPHLASAEEFASYLINEAIAQHCLPREGRIKPLYSVRLSSHKTISPGKKQQLIESCQSPTFRTAVATSLKFSLFFEQPLYVGKSNCMRERIRQHLLPSSPLRRRLDRVGVSIARQRLICLSLNGLAPATENTTHDRGPDASPAGSESPLEEIISKLFHPLFVERYG